MKVSHRVAERATFVDPADLFRGTIVVLAPHMDDEVLACGGTLARIPDKERVQVIYATDGSRSPAPALPWRSAPPGLAGIRVREAREALAVLGVPQRNLHFLGLPDGRLRNRAVELERALGELLDAARPDHLLAPFRYDRHPDHLAVSRAATRWTANRGHRAELLEYFVYHRSRLLPAGDIRAYIRPGLLLGVDIVPVAAAKRRALACFRSQTTRLFDFQHRPNLTEDLLDEACREPEIFLRSSAAGSGAAVLQGKSVWIRLAHRVEPILKESKDRGVALLRGLLP